MTLQRTTVAFGATLAALALFIGVGVMSASAETAATTATVTTTSATNLSQLETLLKRIAELRALLATLQGDVNQLVKDMEEGAESDDVKKVQELLASDRELYPEARVTGYFGPATREAIKRFQTRYELEGTTQGA